VTNAEMHDEKNLSGGNLKYQATQNIILRIILLANIKKSCRGLYPTPAAPSRV